MRVLLAMLLLAGCARGTAPEAVCTAQANDDPAVAELIRKGAGNPHFQLEHQEELGQAKQRARLACLRSRGLVAPGGVEAQRPL